MTDPKPQRAARNTAIMTTETALKKIRALRSTFDQRKAAAVQAVYDDDRKKTAEYFCRVPAADRDDLHAMLGALGIDVPVIDAEFAEAEEPPPATEAGAEVPVRGTTDYVPGPAARAARGGR